MLALRFIIPLTAVAALAGCALAAPTPPPAPTTTAAVEAVAATLVQVQPGTVVATGALRSLDGLTTGDVSVVAEAEGAFELHIDNVTTPLSGEIVVNLSAVPFSEANYCANGFTIYVFDPQPLAATMSTTLTHPIATPTDAPDFLDTLLLTSNDPASPKTGCFYPLVASAELVWTMPDLRPDITVADSGSTGGATGLVAVSDGRPSSYTVAAGDVLTEVAARFGVSTADIFYLNPNRMPAPEDPQAYADEVLNLDKSSR